MKYDLFGICGMCGSKGSRTRPLTKHHIVPKSKGGNDNASNIILLHDECHRDIHGSRKKRFRLVLEEGK